MSKLESRSIFFNDTKNKLSHRRHIQETKLYKLNSNCDYIPAYQLSSIILPNIHKYFICFNEGSVSTYYGIYTNVNFDRRVYPSFVFYSLIKDHIKFFLKDHAWFVDIIPKILTLKDCYLTNNHRFIVRYDHLILNGNNVQELYTLYKNELLITPFPFCAFTMESYTNILIPETLLVVKKENAYIANLEISLNKVPTVLELWLPESMKRTNYKYTLLKNNIKKNLTLLEDSGIKVVYKTSEEIQNIYQIHNSFDAYAGKSISGIHNVLSEKFEHSLKVNRL